MNFPIVFVIVGVILIIFGFLRLTRGGTEIKRALLVGWRGYQAEKGKDKEQKK